MRSLLGALAIAAIFAFVAWKTGPGLIRDWTLRNNFTPVMADVNGECSGYVVIFTYCDVTLTTPAGATKDTLFFADFTTSDYSVTVVADPNHPSVMSTDLGVTKFWNRVLTLAALLVIFVFVLFSGIREMGQPHEQAPAT